MLLSLGTAKCLESTNFCLGRSRNRLERGLSQLASYNARQK